MFTWFFGRRRVEDVIGLFSKATAQLNDIIDTRTNENLESAALVSEINATIDANVVEIRRANRVAKKLEELLS